MNKVKGCPRKLSCQLWQLICDGDPCIVEKEMEADTYSVKSGYPIMRRNRWHKRHASQPSTISI